MASELPHSSTGEQLRKPFPLTFNSCAHSLGLLGEQGCMGIKLILKGLPSFLSHFTLSKTRWLVTSRCPREGYRSSAPFYPSGGRSSFSSPLSGHFFHQAAPQARIPPLRGQAIFPSCSFGVTGPPLAVANLTCFLERLVSPARLPRGSRPCAEC